MLAPSSAMLLRIYTDEDALFGDQPLTTLIVKRARAAQLAGATVLRGSLGYGHSSRLHTHRPFGLDDNLPVVIEIVDAEAPLRAFVDTLDDLHDIGLITFEKVEVVRYGNQTP
ncbi:DUF190 domain-containing protein [Phenylobacterium sp.]|uniref:DUF190 domain-containing protein n=1 Tax=Phenylobacterium sp. TaxID=1871053 RepID=UPI00272EF5F2|nr:DUF190 domain-containing protein [Phenylobacterium sp.]MDP1616576.1 DUF190 domain-containing protein [Phenylobacterium sp.]